MRTEPRGARVYNFISTNNSKHSSPILNPSNPKNSKPRTRGHFSTPCGRYGSSEIAICLYTLYIYISPRECVQPRDLSPRSSAILPEIYRPTAACLLGQVRGGYPVIWRGYPSLRGKKLRLFPRLQLSVHVHLLFITFCALVRVGGSRGREREIRFHAAALSRRVFTFDRQRLFSLG